MNATSSVPAPATPGKEIAGAGTARRPSAAGHLNSRMYTVGPHPAADRTDQPCHGQPEHVFFPPDGPAARGWSPSAAKKLCRRPCPVLDECRAWAVAAGPELHGVWGATTPRERSVMRGEREVPDA